MARRTHIHGAFKCHVFYKELHWRCIVVRFEKSNHDSIATCHRWKGHLDLVCILWGTACNLDNSNDLARFSYPSHQAAQFFLGGTFGEPFSFDQNGDLHGLASIGFGVHPGSKLILSVRHPLIGSVNRTCLDRRFRVRCQATKLPFHQLFDGIAGSRFSMFGSEMALGRLRWIRHNCPKQNPFGGGHVAFHQDGREGQDVADVVESVADIIRGEILRRVKIDPDQVADRIAILCAIQSAHGHATWIGLGVAIRFRKDPSDQLLKGFRLSDRRSRFVARRHFPAGYHAKNVVPSLSFFDKRLVIAIGIERQFGLNVLSAMALQAVFFQERPPLLRKINRILSGEEAVLNEEPTEEERSSRDRCHRWEPSGGKQLSLL